MYYAIRKIPLTSPIKLEAYSQSMFTSVVYWFDLNPRPVRLGHNIFVIFLVIIIIFLDIVHSGHQVTDALPRYVPLNYLLIFTYLL